MRKRSEARPEPRPAAEFTVPHDPINEQVVIAATIVSTPEVRNKLLTRLAIDHFYLEEHRAIWSALIDMKNRKLGFDIATIQRICGDRVRVSYVLELQENRPDVPENLEYHVDALQWDRKRTTAAKGPIASLLEALRNPQEAPERVRALAKHVAIAFEGHSEKQYIYDPTALVTETMATIRKRIGGHAVYSYGIPGLDYFGAELDGTRQRRMIPGAAPGQTTLVTGVTGSGKSTFTAHLMLGQMRLKRRVLCGAWEVLAPMTLETLAVIDLGWSRSDLLDPAGALARGNPLTPELLVTLEEKMHEISKWVHFVKNPFRRRGGTKRDRFNPNDANLDIVESIISDDGCEVFVADLWARCLASRSPEDEEEALFRYQAMLEEMQVHSVLVHQQRHKDIEMRRDKRPTRDGAKGSGAYVEVADTMIGTHRPAQWKDIEDDTFEAFILKQRFGKWPLGVAFDWNGELGSITGGRSIAYDQPGESYAGEDIGFNAPRGRGGGGKRGKS